MFGFGIHEFFSLPEFNAILFVDDFAWRQSTMRVYGGAPRISWDGITVIKIEEGRLYGEPTRLLAWGPFTVDLRSEQRLQYRKAKASPCFDRLGGMSRVELPPCLKHHAMMDEVDLLRALGTWVNEYFAV